MEYNKKNYSTKIILQLKFSGVVCMGQARARENLDLHGTSIVPNLSRCFSDGGFRDCRTAIKNRPFGLNRPVFYWL